MNLYIYMNIIAYSQSNQVLDNKENNQNIYNCTKLSDFLINYAQSSDIRDLHFGKTFSNYDLNCINKWVANWNKYSKFMGII